MPQTVSIRITQRRKIPGDALGAVIVGGDYQGLGIVRSLGQRGVPVCVVDDEHSIARFSRYATYAAQCADLRNTQATIEALLRVGQRLNLQGWMLFPTRDEIVAALSLHRTELSQMFRVPTPEWNTIQHIWDKRKTYALAEELGIAAPQTWIAQSVEDLDRLITRFPVAVKPAIKEHFFYATKAKAWRANNRAELVTLYRRAASLVPPEEILIQDLIPGDGNHQFSYCAFFKNERALASMVACRKRQHPHEFGRASTFVKTVDCPEVEGPSEELLRRIDYYGLVEVEYKLDPRDGKFKLLDVNARTWGYHTLGACSGVDFPHLLYTDQLSQNALSTRAVSGKSWVRLVTDFPAGLMEVASRRLKFKEYLRSLWEADTEAVFSARDPLPGFVEFLLIPYLALKRGF